MSIYQDTLLSKYDELYFKLISPDGDQYTVHQTDEGDHYIFTLVDQPSHNMFINTKEMKYMMVNSYHRDGWMIEDHRYDLMMESPVTPGNPEDIPFWSHKHTGVYMTPCDTQRWGPLVPCFFTWPFGQLLFI